MHGPERVESTTYQPQRIDYTYQPGWVADDKSQRGEDGEHGKPFLQGAVAAGVAAAAGRLCPGSVGSRGDDPRHPVHFPQHSQVETHDDGHQQQTWGGKGKQSGQGKGHHQGNGPR